MQYLNLAVFLLGMTALASAQVSFASGSYDCPPRGGAYCAGNSLETNIIIRCTGSRGQPGNCNDNLAGVPPTSVKTFAPCYQSSPDAGDAACSFNGVAYPDEGASFPISGGSNATNGSMTTLTSTSTTIINVGTTVAASTSRPTPSGGFGYNGTTITGSVTVPTINPGSTSPPYTGGGCATAVKSFFLGIGLALVVGLML